MDRWSGIRSHWTTVVLQSLHPQARVLSVLQHHRPIGIFGSRPSRLEIAVFLADDGRVLPDSADASTTGAKKRQVGWESLGVNVVPSAPEAWPASLLHPAV